MNGNKLLLDTNILIYLSKGDISLSDFAKGNDSLFISAITIMEVKGFKFKSLIEEAMINTMCDKMGHVYIDDAIVKEVIRIRKQKKMKLPDAIILGSAIVYDQILVTRNSDDFVVPGVLLHVLNPFKSNKP